MRTSVYLMATLSVMQAKLGYERYPDIPEMRAIYRRAMRTKARLDRHFFGM